MAPKGPPPKAVAPPTPPTPPQAQQNIQQQQQQQQQGTPGTPPGNGRHRQIGVPNTNQIQQNTQQQQQQQQQQTLGTPGTPPATRRQWQSGPKNQTLQNNQQQTLGAPGTPPATGQQQQQTLGTPGTPPATGRQQQQQTLGPQGPQGVPGWRGPTRQPPGTGQPQLNNSAVTLQQGHVDQLRSNRIERREGNGRLIIQEPGGRFIVREEGRAFIRHDETARFRAWGGAPRLERRGSEQYAYIGRPGGYQIITVTGPDGRLLRRVRRGPDGREVILINNNYRNAAIAGGFLLALAAPAILIPREQYIVDVSNAPPDMLYETLEAPPLVELERPYSLDEIRYNVNLRDRTRRLDLDAITFDTGSWQIMPEQYPRLEVIANVLRRILANNPNAIFLIEGHTDAIGNDVDNLSLSDRRAESVAVVLTETFQIPPENLVTQGYGEQFLKIPTDGPSRENRRVAVRNITRLLAGR